MIFGHRFGGPLSLRLAGFCSSGKAGPTINWRFASVELAVVDVRRDYATTVEKIRSQLRSRLGALAILWYFITFTVPCSWNQDSSQQKKERGGSRNLRGHFRLQPATRSIFAGFCLARPPARISSKVADPANSAGLGLRTSDSYPQAK